MWFRSNVLGLRESMKPFTIEHSSGHQQPHVIYPHWYWSQLHKLPILLSVPGSQNTVNFCTCRDSTIVVWCEKNKFLETNFLSNELAKILSRQIFKYLRILSFCGIVAQLHMLIIFTSWENDSLSMFSGLYWVWWGFVNPRSHGISRYSTDHN